MIIQKDYTKIIMFWIAFFSIAFNFLQQHYILKLLTILVS
jgi:hypothetical protein